MYQERVTDIFNVEMDDYYMHLEYRGEAERKKIHEAITLKLINMNKDTLLNELLQDEKAITKMREKIGFTQEQFAQAFDIPVGTLRRWEQGKTKCPPHIIELLYYKIYYVPQSIKPDTFSINTIFNAYLVYRKNFAPQGKENNATDFLLWCKDNEDILKK